MSDSDRSNEATSTDEDVERSPGGADAPDPESASTSPEGGGDDAAASEADDADDDADDGDEQAGEGGASPEQIAKRVAALGAEDELDRLARAEEEKLAARRASAKKKGKKGGGLERAASKKLEQIGAKKRSEPKRPLAVAAVDADPLIERTAKLSDWVKENQQLVTKVGVAVLVALIGLGGWLYYQRKHETDASVALAAAVADERGRIGEAPKGDDEPVRDPRPVFKSYAERGDAALEKYRAVQSKFPKTGAAILARLAEAGILLDKRDADGALVAYGDVVASPLAAADSEVRGRALEGLGFAHELKAQSDPAQYDEALKRYKELENTVEEKGFKELAMYHQARCLEAKGDRDGAKELLKTIRERVQNAEDAPGARLTSTQSFPYLREVATDRLRKLDPSAVPAKPAGALGGVGGDGQMNEAQLRRLMEQLKKQQGGDDGHGHGGP